LESGRGNAAVSLALLPQANKGTATSRGERHGADFNDGI
jgi:hypothetical protein